MKPKRKNTQVPQPSGSTENVADEAVHKEWGDRLVRDATTASSLTIDQDSGNIDKTQSKVTPNESSSQGTDSSGGPSDEDRMKLNELMELCTNLQTMVLDLEKRKTIQALEITSLKGRVKKLEKNLGKDASKQGKKINDIDADEDITLVNDQDYAEMFDVNDLHGEEVFVEKEVADKEVNDEVQKVVEEVVKDTNTAKLFVNVAHVSAAGIVNVASIATTKTRKFFAAKRAEDKRNKPPTQAQQRKIMCTYLKNMERKELNELKNKSFDSIQKLFDRAFKRVNIFVDFRTELVEVTTGGTRVKTISESYYYRYKEVTIAQVDVSVAQEL
nr:hypothetical protein [Tanacetum cinerariifolium]